MRVRIGSGRTTHPSYLQHSPSGSLPNVYHEEMFNIRVYITDLAIPHYFA